MDIKVREHGGIIYVTAPNQYILCDTFMRMQEFYESPIPCLRGNYFAEETFRDEYAKKFQKFNYHTTWVGFNVPGNIVKEFYKKFHDLSMKEQVLKNLLKPFLKSNKKFYIIGTIESDREGTLEHEIAHARYYLNRSYRLAQNKVFRSMPRYIQEYFINALIQMKYDKSVGIDETQAYLCSTLDLWYLKKNFRVKEMSWIRNKLIHLRSLPYLFKFRKNFPRL